MPNESEANALQELIQIMALLRSENGCQWDRQQTPETLKKHILEETYELLEAIDKGNPTDICDELGDLLLQVVFQAQIFSEARQFGINEVAKSISDKLKRRHPHIFADASHEGQEQRWEEIKQQERSARGQSNQLSQRIPQTLPALQRATKLAKKCPLDNPLETVQKLHRQLEEIESTIRQAADQTASLELPVGQILYDICQLSAATHLDPEDLLRKKTTQMITQIDAQKNV